MVRLPDFLAGFDLASRRLVAAISTDFDKGKPALQVTMADFHQALSEVKPAFGAVTETLESYRPRGMISYGVRMQKLIATCDKLVRQASLFPASSYNPYLEKNAPSTRHLQ